MNFKAAVLVESKKPLVIEELEVPPLRFGQVLVKIVCSGICGAQINEIDAVKGLDKYLPHLLGHEATAVVLDTGEGVTRVKKGDTVVCHWRKSGGVQAPTATYRSRLGDVNSGWVTTFSEISVVSENRVTPIPADFNPEWGALFGCAVTTAMGVLNNDARLGIGESIVVFGAGGVGLNIVQFAAMIAAHPIVAVDVHDHKLQLARRLGATHVVNAAKAKGDTEAEIRKSVGEADVAVENTGLADVIEMAYRVTAPKGRVILVGVPNKSARHPSLYTLPLHFEKVLRGSEGGGCKPDVDIPKLVRLCLDGKLTLDQLVGRRYPLACINQGITDLRQGSIAGRCIIQMDG